jgi:penicillin amidase
MKMWKHLLIVFLALVLVPTAVYLYLDARGPNYSGEFNLSGLSDDVEVSFDDFGIPHIKGANKTDLYCSFGYTIASERLFQMEMMRRVGHGKLSEILGSEFISTDVLFRSLLGPEYIQRQVDRLESTGSLEMNAEITAYLSGVNQFILQGPSPMEFAVLGIEKTPFDKSDLFAIAGYMAYSFGFGQRTDPLITYIQEKLGPEYLEKLGLFHELGDGYIPGYGESQVSSIMSEKLFGMSNQEFPVPLWEGSNSWAVSGELTKSGRPVICNDTHISYSVPQVWYEAHLSCPGFNFYGYFLGGIPYALIGHNEVMAWGLTMLEQDDMDFYHEEVDFNLGTYIVDEQEYKLEERNFDFVVKDGSDTTITVRYTSHGPLVSQFYDSLDDELNVSLWWDYSRFDNDLIHAFHGLNNCKGIEEAQFACSQIHGPGLNLTYADTSNNIACWACAKIQNRPSHVNSKCFIDGSKSVNNPIGYYDFSKNPKSINPPWNWVYSANDQPGPIDSLFIQGYYKPNNRADRIKKWLNEPIEWTVDSMKQVMTDVQSDLDSEIAAVLREIILGENDQGKHDQFINLLEWTGGHELDDASPILYYRLLYHILSKAMQDELGSDKFANYLNTNWSKRSYPLLIQDDKSPWWDNISTPQIETRSEIINSAFLLSIKVLQAENGDLVDWRWGDNHSLTLEHPFAKESNLMAKFLNIGPYPIRGGFATINQASFSLDKTSNYAVKLGSQMRIILDLGQLDSGISIAPSGQSGHVLSPYYSDQAELYRQGGFRPQLWNKLSIEKLDNKLILRPHKSN